MLCKHRKGELAMSEGKVMQTGTTGEQAKTKVGVQGVPETFNKDTGEMILGKDLSNTLKREKADLSITYTKTGFDAGEVRPEYYYDCKMKTPDMQKAVQYTKEDQPINFEISSGIRIFDASFWIF